MAVGRVTRPHGVRGEVYVRVDSDDPGRFEPPARLRTSDDRFPLLVVREARPGPHGLIVEFAGVTTVERARELVGVTLLIEADDRRVLDEGEYWPEDLIGLRVRDTDGDELGTVVDMILGPQDRLVVDQVDGERFEIPFVEPLVPEVRVADGWLRIDPPEGLVSPR